MIAEICNSYRYEVAITAKELWQVTAAGYTQLARLYFYSISII